MLNGSGERGNDAGLGGHAGEEYSRQSEDVSDTLLDGAISGLATHENTITELDKYFIDQERRCKGLLGDIKRLLTETQDPQQQQVDSAERKEEKLRQDTAAARRCADEAERRRDEKTKLRERLARDSAAVLNVHRAEAARLRALRAARASAEQEIAERRVEIQALRIELHRQEETQQLEFDELWTQCEEHRVSPADIDSLLEGGADMWNRLGMVDHSANVASSNADKLAEYFLGRKPPRADVVSRIFTGAARSQGCEFGAGGPHGAIKKLGQHDVKRVIAEQVDHSASLANSNADKLAEYLPGQEPPRDLVVSRIFTEAACPEVLVRPPALDVADGSRGYPPPLDLNCSPRRAANHIQDLPCSRRPPRMPAIQLEELASKLVSVSEARGRERGGLATDLAAGRQ